MSELLDLVESLQQGLTTTDRPLQRDAFTNLNEGLKKLPISAFSEKEVNHVVKFYVTYTALPNPELVSILLDGLYWFADSSLLSPDDAVKICSEGFFSTLYISTLGKEERQKAIRLLSSLLTKEKSRKGLLTMKLEFIRGFIASVEGEKDPVCLSIIFDMHCIVMRHFSLGHYEEDYFDCVAAYFPVDYTPPAGNPSGVTRAELAEKLHKALFTSRHLAGSLLLPLLLEKAASHWPQGRGDALDLLADCLTGRVHSQLQFTDFRLQPDSHAETEKPFSLANISAYLFAICNLIRELSQELDPMEQSPDMNRLLTIVCGLTLAYTSQKDENTTSDFIETFFTTLYPDRKEKFVLDSFFSVPPPCSLGALPTLAPNAALAESLLTAAVTSLESGAVNDLCSCLFHRLAEAVLSPSVVDPIPADPVFYEAKYDQLIAWTPHLGFLNRLLATLERLSPDFRKNLFATPSELQILAFNLSRFLQVACCKLSLCTPSQVKLVQDAQESREDALHRKLAEASLFGLLTRVIVTLLERAGTHIDSCTAEAMLSLCRHMLDHMAHDADDDSLDSIRLEQRLLFVKLLSASSPIGESLLTILFDLFQVDAAGVSTSILQRAACESEAILTRLLTSLFEHNPSNGRTLATMLLSIAKSLRQEPVRLASVSCILRGNVRVVWALVDRLIGGNDQVIITDLLDAFRLITSGLGSEEQENLLKCFSPICGATTVSTEKSSVIFESAILSALRPDVISARSKPLFDNLKLVIHAVVSDSNIPEVQTVGLLNCLASLLNKSMDPVATSTFSAVLDDLALHHRRLPLASHLVVTGLRALLACPPNLPQNRQALLDRLLNILFPAEGEPDNLELSRACLTDAIHQLIPIDSDHGCISTALHCQVSSLMMQKCYCLIGLKLRRAWKEASTLNDAYLFAYLKLTTLLPEAVITDYMGDALEAAVVAITSGQYPLATQALGLSLISLIASQLPNGISASGTSGGSGISSADTDDLFEKLPALLVSSSSDCGNANAHKAELRFHLARSLTYLVDLPVTVISRHKLRVSRLLEELLDDSCRSVRLEAVRAKNRWVLKV